MEVMQGGSTRPIIVKILPVYEIEKQKKMENIQSHLNAITDSSELNYVYIIKKIFQFGIKQF